MSNLLFETIKIYQENSINFNNELEYHLLNGIVLSDNKTFMLAVPCDSENTEMPVPIDNANCIFISMLTGNMKHGLEVLGHKFDSLAFKRQFKNSNHTRLYSYSKFYKKLK